MRLIDADALKKDDELTEWITRDTIRTGKMLKAFSELFVKKIDDAPTVNAVSEEVYTREYNLRKDAEFKVYKLEKALEQKPFDIETYCKEHFTVMVDKDVWEKAEKALKQEPKWIPVSERLPEKNMPCLVSVGELYLTQIAMYSDLMGTIDHKIFYQGIYGKNDFENITEYVKAWMPLPTPYKAESEVSE